jgi:hypothetical protein
MKKLFLFLATGFIFLNSCETIKGVKPSLKLVKGEKYKVNLDVDMKNHTSIFLANLGDEKQRFEIAYEWEVTNILADTEYVIHSKIASLTSHLVRKNNFDDGIVIGKGNGTDSVQQVRYIPIDSVLNHIRSAEFDFKITNHGEITEVHGADSAIYGAFVKAYGNVPDTIYKNDYYLLKSFFGNVTFSNFIESFFAAYESPEGWIAGDDFDNVTEMHEQLETIDQDYIFYSRNEWACSKTNDKYDFHLKGHLVKGKDDENNNIGYDLKVKGTQNGSLQYDTLTYLPVTAKLDQQYEISSGMSNVIFSFKLSSFVVERTMEIKIEKIK